MVLAELIEQLAAQVAVLMSPTVGRHGHAGATGLTHGMKMAVQMPQGLEAQQHQGEPKQPSAFADGLCLQAMWVWLTHGPRIISANHVSPNKR